MSPPLRNLCVYKVLFITYCTILSGVAKSYLNDKHIRNLNNIDSRSSLTDLSIFKETHVLTFLLVPITLQGGGRFFSPGLVNFRCTFTIHDTCVWCAVPPAEKKSFCSQKEETSRVFFSSELLLLLVYSNCTLFVHTDTEYITLPRYNNNYYGHVSSFLTTEAIRAPLNWNIIARFVMQIRL